MIRSKLKVIAVKTPINILPVLFVRTMKPFWFLGFDIFPSFLRIRVQCPNRAGPTVLRAPSAQRRRSSIRHAQVSPSSLRFRPPPPPPSPPQGSSNNPGAAHRAQLPTRYCPFPPTRGTAKIVSFVLSFFNFPFLTRFDGHTIGRWRSIVYGWMF